MKLSELKLNPKAVLVVLVLGENLRWCPQHINRANYSNRGWREKIFENMFFEAERRGKLFQMKVLGAAIDSDKFSSKSELSSRFFGRLKFSALFE